MPPFSSATPKPETSYARITSRLRAEIVSGALPPGTWLRMDATGRRFGVSVQPVREALQQLEGEGLVEMIPNRGARVRELDRRRVIQNHEIGAALEGFAARRFAEEASGSDMRRIEKIQAEHDAAVAAENWQLIDQFNIAFHATINGLGGNDELVGLVSRHYGLAKTLQLTLGKPAGYLARVRSEHRALLAAFRSHDGDAAARIGTEHVLGGLAELLESVYPSRV